MSAKTLPCGPILACLERGAWGAQRLQLARAAEERNIVAEVTSALSASSDRTLVTTSEAAIEGSTHVYANDASKHSRDEEQPITPPPASPPTASSVSIGIKRKLTPDSLSYDELSGAPAKRMPVSEEQLSEKQQ